jgi:predicted RNase H-like HicB family nuclease
METVILDSQSDPELMERARSLAEQYRLTLQSTGQGGYVGSSVELPRVFAEGSDVESCVQSTRQALAGAVAVMWKTGRQPPAPMRERRRDEQINLRVSADEKLLLEASARQQGFRSVSDYVRTRALDGATRAAG